MTRILLTLLMPALMLIMVTPLLSCKGFHTRFDRKGLEKLALSMTERFEPGSPEELEEYLRTLDPGKTGAPVEEVPYSREALDHWNLADRIEGEIEETRISFPGRIRVDPGHPASTAYLYHYAHRNAAERAATRKTVLFLPGLGVSELAFHFIDRLMIDILNRGYNLLLYIPPYHLIRGTGAEDENLLLFDADLTRTLDTFFAMVSEIRTGMALIRRDKPDQAAFEGWGGSLGAALLLEVSRHERIERANLMIPVLDWGTIITGEICGSICLPKLEEAGFDLQLIERALAEMSPSGKPLSISPSNLMIQAAEFDQLTPLKKILDYGERKGIAKLKVYRKGHATMLLDRRLYRDYRDFLAEAVAVTGN
jgi:hypothetical protein